MKKILAKVLDEDHGKILKKDVATDIIFPERDMAYRTARGLSRPNVLDFIPLSEEYNLVQIESPKEFIGKSIRELNLRAKNNVHIIAIKQVSPDNFILNPPPDYIISEISILILLGKSGDIAKIKGIARCCSNPIYPGGTKRFCHFTGLIQTFACHPAEPSHQESAFYTLFDDLRGVEFRAAGIGIRG
jgi:hypothetical protein